MSVGGGAGGKTILRPDPFYVDQALSTLENLASMGIPVLCNQWVNLPPNPDVINIDARWHFDLLIVKK